MRPSVVIFALVFMAFTPVRAQLQVQDSGADAQLRGVAAVSSKIAWASGTKGTVLRTEDGGQTWKDVSVKGAEALDFRDVQAFDAQAAFVLSIGPGEQSRIYKTNDGGQHWKLQFTNNNPKAFYDCFAFWDRTHGIALSDSVDGKFLLLQTTDGNTWNELHPRTLPAALPNEGAFAASGTCVAKNDVWFATGGPAARVFHSTDRGQTWIVTTTPILSGAASQGIFSVAFWSRSRGIIVGGDYKDPTRTEKNAAFTTDGGKTWTLAEKGPAGYRSAVAVVPYPAAPLFVAVGINGSDFSDNGGKTWTPIDTTEYNAVSLPGPYGGWFIGPKGKIVFFNPALTLKP